MEEFKKKIKEEIQKVLGDGTPEGVNTITSRHHRFYKRHPELKYIGFHGYRHTYASIAVASGKTDIKTIQEILGHSNVSTTLDLYATGYSEVKLDKQKALLQLMTKLNEAKVSVREEGTISADELEKELGL